MDPTVNYKDEVLEYARVFTHDQEHLWKQYHKSFYEMVSSWFPDQTPVNQQFWYGYLQHCINVRAKSFDIKKKYVITDQVKKFYCFLTINYDDKTSINIKLMHKFAERVCKLQNVIHCTYVHEKFRKEQNIHHHTHMLITTDKYIHASKMIEPIWKIKELQAYVGQKTFLDCQVSGAKSNKAHAYEDYQKYLTGEKTEEKLPFVLKDRAWRIHEGYEHSYDYTKN